MVRSIPGQQSLSEIGGLPPQKTTPSASTGSFTDQLTAALEGYLAQSSNGSNLEIDIQATQSQNSGVRQFLVTVKTPGSAPGQAASSVSATSTGPISVPLASGSDQNSAAAATPSAAPLNEADAYWAAQPEAVQEMRYADAATRSVLAQQLSGQGYAIDTPIMVWGWDPMMTMQGRQQDGYTWVPSWNQSPVSTPGLAVGKQIPYDPSNPPKGSILVSTDFAKAAGTTSSSS